MADPSISIAMCTYNGERYVQEQFDSFVRQTRLPDELIVCDDGSTDRTADIVATFVRLAPFDVRVVVQPANLGRIANFESAISRCSKDIIFLSDQDDVWLKDKIEVMTRALCGTPEAGGVFCNSQVVDSHLVSKGYSAWDICRFTSEVQDEVRRDEAFAAMLSRPVAQGACLAFRSEYRSLLLPLAPDWGHDSWIAILLAASSRLVVVDDELVLWRQHESNLMGAPPPGRPLSARNWLRKLRNPRQYYRGKLDGVADADRLLDQLEERLAIQNEPRRFAKHMAVIARRRHRLSRRRRSIEVLLGILGDNAERAT